MTSSDYDSYYEYYKWLWVTTSQTYSDFVWLQVTASQTISDHESDFNGLQVIKSQDYILKKQFNILETLSGFCFSEKILLFSCKFSFIYSLRIHHNQTNELLLAVLKKLFWSFHEISNQTTVGKYLHYLSSNNKVLSFID